MQRTAGSCVLLITMAVSGCGTLPSGQPWGAGATFTPGWERVRESAVDAARDPWVWAPLLGAAAFQIDDWDRRSADWARQHTPVFGSTRNAEEWSDYLRDASAFAHYATVIATPGGEDASTWVLSKARGALVGVAAVSSTVFVTRNLKTGIDRERPNELAGESFPSGHTSSSAVHARLASRNLSTIAMNETLRTGLDVGLVAVTVGTSWARIEGGWHYPSDTLFSMALGNFIASLVNDAFMGLNNTATLAFAPTSGGGIVQWRWQF